MCLLVEFLQLQLEAEQGDANAQYKVGVEYANGHCVKQDYQQVAKWFRLAAEQGHQNAQYDLGVVYARGQGVPQDFKEAVK